MEILLSLFTLAVGITVFIIHRIFEWKLEEKKHRRDKLEELYLQLTNLFRKVINPADDDLPPMGNEGDKYKKAIANRFLKIEDTRMHVESLVYLYFEELKEVFDPVNDSAVMACSFLLQLANAPLEERSALKREFEKESAKMRNNIQLMHSKIQKDNKLLIHDLIK